MGLPPFSPSDLLLWAPLLGINPQMLLFGPQLLIKFSVKLENWRFSYISKGGRLTLIQATLSSISTYMLSVFKVPQSICKKVDKLIRTFLWCGTSVDNNLRPLISWDVVTAAKDSGGFDIFKTKVSNNALQIKWLWRYYQEDQPLWKRLVNAKYNIPQAGALPTQSRFSNSRAPWFSIVKHAHHFKQFTKWGLRNGNKIFFWQDSWSNNLGPLNLLHPRFFAFSTRQDMKVFEAWVSSSYSWNIFPRRPLLDREVSLWDELIPSLPRPSSSRGPFSTALAHLSFWDSSSIMRLQVDLKVLTNLWRARILKKPLVSQNP